MPNGATHTSINLLVLGGLSVGYSGLTHQAFGAGQHLPLPVLMFAGGFIVGTLFITPDLDFGGRVRTVARQHWGVLEVIWLPLGRLVKHRGLTHTYLRGSSLLLGYAVVILGLFTLGCWTLAQTAGVRLPMLTWPTPAALFGAWLGYLIAYGLHLWLDGYQPWDMKRW